MPSQSGRSYGVPLAVLAVFVSLLTAAGCKRGTGDYKTVPVSGILTCQGKPVAKVQVIFSPQPGAGRPASSPGRSAMGETDANGKFVLSTYGMNDGAIPGTHDVMILLMDDPERPAPAASKKNIAPCLHETRVIEVKRGMAEVILNLGE